MTPEGIATFLGTLIGTAIFAVLVGWQSRRLDALQKAHEQSRTTQETLDDKLVDLLEEVNKTSTEKDREIAVLRHELATTRAEFSIRIASLERQIKMLAQEKDQLVEQRDQAIRERDAAVQERDQAILERDSARAELERLRKAINGAKASITTEFHADQS